MELNQELEKNQEKAMQQQVPKDTALALPGTVSAAEINKIQERIAWLEMNLSDSNHIIDNLLDRVDKLERQIRYLASMQETPSAVCPQNEEVPPPHY